MDDMMNKMMSNMGSMNMATNMSSSSSFSSSSSSSMMSSDMMSMPGMPPMRGMEMPSMPGFPSMQGGLAFEEMSSMPPSAAPTPAPEYTVTSPPMSPPPEMNHRVQKTEDYVPPPTETAEATVLLKVKEGDEYKLALSMQQYSLDDITIKLNGNE